MPLFPILLYIFNILFLFLSGGCAEIDRDFNSHNLSASDANDTILRENVDQPTRDDVIVFVKVFTQLVKSLKKERLEASFKEERCQERRIRSSQHASVVIILNSEVGEEITLTSLLYKEDEPWSVCRRSCLTSRVRKCRIRKLCSVDVLVEEAHCYIPGSQCEKTVKKLLGQTPEQTQTTKEEQTTETTGIFDDHSSEKPEKLYYEQDEGNKEHKKDASEDFYYDPFIIYPSKSDYYEYTDAWDYIFSDDVTDYNNEKEDEKEREDNYNQMESEELQPVDNPPIRQGDCGQSSVSVPFRMFRIIGGRDAIKGSWPWQVAIFNKFKELFCGGTLISSRWVLTAAHCVKKRIFIRVGEHDISLPDGEIKIKVEKSFQHPDFNLDTIDSDIGLLKLQKDVFQQAPRLKKACLPQQAESLPRKQSCIVMGWGKQEETHIFGSDVLQYVKVPIAGKKACQRAYDSMEITRNMFCAGALRADACDGDSGGPLLCQDKDKRWVLHGVTSFGEGCGEKDSWGVYVKVSNYVDWIAETIRLN